MSGLSGIGKSATVLAALRRIDLRASAVRVVRSASSRPYAHGLAGRGGIDLGKQTRPTASGPGYEVDPVGLLEAVSAGIEIAPTGTRVLFIDDLEVLSPIRAAWLLRLGEAAYERGWRIMAAVRQAAPTSLPDDIERLAVGPLDEPSLRLVLADELSLPIAADVVSRLHRWSAGNPRIALELAHGLSPAQQRGDIEWPGPQSAGPAARRAYRYLLDGSGTTTDDATVSHPLLALVHDELSATPTDEAGRSTFAGSATVAEAIWEGLHLDDVAQASRAGAEPRAAARAVGVTLLTGSIWAENGTGRWTPPAADAEWTDHLWWRDPTGVALSTRAAGARAAAALIELEHAGRLTDPAALRADLGLIGTVPEPHWVGLCVQVRGRLLLGDVSGARLVLEKQSGIAEGRSVAELVARDLAAARVAMFEGRAMDARTHLVRATDLRPSVQDWLPVRGLRVATTAMLDGKPPVTELPSQTGAWSTRALGEFAVDLGLAHLAVGHMKHAAELLTTGLERCAWPYRGRAQVRADLVESVAAHDPTPEARILQVRWLLDPPVSLEERADADADTAHERMLAILDSGTGRNTIDEWLPVSLSPISPWQRLRTLIAYGRHTLTHGERNNAEAALRDARALARVTGLPGWDRAIDAYLSDHGARDERSWDELSEDEVGLVRLALRGATNAQIAEIAYVSVRTVANRFRQIYAVLRVRDRRELTETARSHPPKWLADET
ncbi:helix-turn-helix transcriptional regulator [Promicromonospora sp. NPDC059942]|uniref:helix-turn-helix domain-containing protein n=1 Tax=Promicromonospora sp. NPDC059942 TaxID=3347009 RepID=UPI00364CA5DF